MSGRVDQSDRLVSHPSATALSVDFGTADGTAQSPLDYVTTP
jgi:hypothetical protein